MYNRFTDRARKVMQMANQEAQRLNHEYIAPEHILLGIIREGNGTATIALQNLDVDLRRVRLEVEKLVEVGPDMVTMGKLPLTPSAKKVIELSIEEAKNLKHNYVGTEHLLIGLLCDQDSVAGQVLGSMDVTVENARDAIMEILGSGEEERTAGSTTFTTRVAHYALEIFGSAGSVPVESKTERALFLFMLVRAGYRVEQSHITCEVNGAMVRCQTITVRDKDGNYSAWTFSASGEFMGMRHIQDEPKKTEWSFKGAEKSEVMALSSVPKTTITGTATSHGPCAYCGTDVIHSFPYWTCNPDKPEAKPIHNECFAGYHDFVSMEGKLKIWHDYKMPGEVGHIPPVHQKVTIHGYPGKVFTIEKTNNVNGEIIATVQDAEYPLLASSFEVSLTQCQVWTPTEG